MDKKKITFEIKERIAVLSESGSITKEINKVSYNGNPAKYDLRSWGHYLGDNGEATISPLKGLTLTDSETAALADALAGRNIEKPADPAADTK